MILVFRIVAGLALPVLMVIRIWGIAGRVMLAGADGDGGAGDRFRLAPE